MIRLIAISAVLIASPCLAEEKAYNCKLEPPMDVRDFESPTRLSEINLFNMGPGKWEFRLTLEDNRANIRWPKSPMQLQGETPLINTGPKAYAGFLVSRGPCLFTNAHCGSMIHFSEQKDATLDLLLEPVALIKLSEDKYEPYKVFIDGTCVARGESE